MGLLCLPPKVWYNMTMKTFSAGDVLKAQDLNDNFAAVGGKVLQVVRATDTTERTTTSTSYQDAGISVTITPQKSDSAILVLSTFYFEAINFFISTEITDSSNNALSGAEGTVFGPNSDIEFFGYGNVLGYATPATTSAVTYKLRFKTTSPNTAKIRNGLRTGQMFAIEVGA